MLIGSDNWSRHRRWCWLVCITAAAAVLWSAWVRQETVTWPGGGSVPGFTFGVAGGAIIIFEMLLWFRKQVRAWRLGRAQSWMRAHIWLGLLCLPLLILHSGFRLGGPLSTWLMALLVVVIASGVWGLVLQQWLPRLMLDQVEAETIYSQIQQLSKQMLKEAQRMVETVCGGAETSAAIAEDAGAHLVVGAVRTVGRVRGKVLETRAAFEPVAGSDALREFFVRDVVPFLESGGASRSVLCRAGPATNRFEQVRAGLPADAHDALRTLEDLCNQKRQWEQQARIHFWLHSWLWVHFPLSLALVVLMFLHAWMAIKFW